MRLLIIGEISSDVNKAIDIAKAKQIKVIMVENITEALDFVREGKGADLILVDVKFDIKTLVSSLEAERISTPVISYGIQCSPKEAVNSINAGAKEFIPLPPDEKLIAAIFASISSDSKNIISKSSAMQKVIDIASKIASSDASVLITGKSGTGKEVIASYIHKHSLRKDKPYVRVNCAAIPEHLLESELFGHEKGAFTGALARRIGKFEESSGGTLLLDEISEMDIKLQAKLLRAIQEHEIDRVGGNGPVKVDLRILATSNRDLPQAIKDNTFREDLYFRLNIINIEIPSLAERKDDISELSQNFIKKYCASNSLEIKHLSPSAIEKMQNYDWPGNVRELENTIHRAVLLSNGRTIEADDINIKIAQDKSEKEISTGEKNLILNTVNYCLGDLSNAANILGISINILKEKLKLYTDNKQETIK